MHNQYGLLNGAFLVTLNNPQPIFEGHAIIWHWISETVRDTGIVTMNY